MPHNSLAWFMSSEKNARPMHFCEKPPDGALAIALARIGRHPGAEIQEIFFQVRGGGGVGGGGRVGGGGKVEKWD